MISVYTIANTFKVLGSHTAHPLFYHVFSIRISSQPSRSRLPSAIHNYCHPSLTFALLCLSSARHSSPHIYFKACPLARHSVAGLEMCSGARLGPRVGKLNGTRKSSQTLPPE